LVASSSRRDSNVSGGNTGSSQHAVEQSCEGVLLPRCRDTHTHTRAHQGAAQHMLAQRATHAVACTRPHRRKRACLRETCDPATSGAAGVCLLRQHRCCPHACDTHPHTSAVRLQPNPTEPNPTQRNATQRNPTRLSPPAASRHMLAAMRVLLLSRPRRRCTGTLTAAATVDSCCVTAAEPSTTRHRSRPGTSAFTTCEAGCACVCVCVCVCARAPRRRCMLSRVLMGRLRVTRGRLTTQHTRPAHQVLQEALVRVVVCKRLPPPQHLLPLHLLLRVPVAAPACIGRSCWCASVGCASSSRRCCRAAICCCGLLSLVLACCEVVLRTARASACAGGCISTPHGRVEFTRSKSDRRRPIKSKQVKVGGLCG
jgi:hypothetical protein